MDTLNTPSSPRQVAEEMFKQDRFSQFLGIVIREVSLGGCRLEMPVREEMVNGFGIVHGGVTFSLADSALAFASNSHGRLSVVIEASISYPAPANIGDTLTAVAEQISLTNRMGIYNITITNQRSDTVALFKGTVYRTKKPPVA